MPIAVVSRLTPEQVWQEVTGFAKKYVADWEDWLNTQPGDKARKFGSILRKWQATRPSPMRRTRVEANHAPPYLEDLIAQAKPHLNAIRDVTLRSISDIGPSQREALHGLWDIFKALSWKRPATCVGITKAVLLLTNGRIGPAFDSRVRSRLGIGYIENPEEWIATLIDIGTDISTFELTNGVLFSKAVPPQFRYLEAGRLYDMILGPREVQMR